MCKVTIIDSMCGTGKTSYAINKMKDDFNKDMNYIYITPYLNEVKRIKENVTNRTFYEPTNRNNKGSKLQGFKDLIIKDKDIASTHALFTSVDNEVYDLLKASNYTLILDEVMNVIDSIKVTKSDFNILIDQKLIRIEENTNKIIWIDKEYSGKLSDIKLLAENDNLYLHTRNREDDKVILLVWTFPAEIFKAFKEIYILTYLFKGQLQRAYYDMFNIKYEYKSVRYIDNEFKLIDYIDYNHEDKEHLKRLINIYEGKLNIIGDDDYSISSSWLRNPKHKEQLNKLKNNTYNYFKHIIKSKAKYNMWTTILGTEDKKDTIRIALSGDGYARSFISCNCRATNQYANKNCIAYLLNRFLNPLDKGFFEDKGIIINEDLWTLSELIQFIWRSAIRNNEEINIFIPSLRMRKLLKDYINNKVQI